jgi:cell division protein FtsB
MVVLRRALLPTLFLGVVAVVLLTFVFPTGTLLAQRADISQAERDLAALHDQQATLDQRADELTKDSEIERLAREQYNLVRPGEEAYALLPAPGAAEAPTALDDHAPPAPPKRNVLQRAWHAISGIF